ncbi:MAG TPA: hypothetical protein VK698_23865 [Kofleriaceae bacterium]|nr:hypothetical protein [Kofleriaceae bacterium]
MTQEAMLEELEAVAARLAVKVTYEALAATVGSGGLCRVKGQYRVIIDKRTQLGERLAALAHALGQLPMVSPMLVAKPAANRASKAAPDAAQGAAAAGQAGDDTVALSRPVRDLLRHYQALRAS